MDTISRESNSSILPIGSLIAGVLGALLAVVALFKITSATKTLALHTEQLAKVESLEAEVRNSVATSEKVNTSVTNLAKQTNDAFQQVALEIGNVRGEIVKIQESAKAAPKAAASKGGPVVAGPGEYVVKSGDTGVRIARANNVAIGDLQAVNPGVNWNSLKVGQKVKLPQK
ncbi:MAG TPA: LysM domain-containing protein [Opitutaceae bacterium]